MTSDPFSWWRTMENDKYRLRTTVDGDGLQDGEEPLDQFRDGGVCFRDKHVKALMRWLPPDNPPFKNEFELAGYWRNLMRHAHRDGVRMLAYMAAEGLLGRDEDPVAVLRDMIARDRKRKGRKLTVALLQNMMDQNPTK
jgi:hypothetical protein